MSAKKTKKVEVFDPMSPKEVARRKREKMEFLKKFRRAISKNLKVPLLTRAQVLKWYNMSPEMLDKAPVAMLVDGEPRYLEYQLDHEIVRSLDDMNVTVDRQTGQMVTVTRPQNFLKDAKKTKPAKARKKRI